jgi:hypothetical protein
MKKLFLIAATFFSLTVVADPFCNSQLAKPKEQLVFSKLYKNQTVDAIKEKHVQFGFESEYVESEAGPLLKAYMPDPDHFPVTQKQWLEMTDEQRLDFILDNEDAMFPYRKPGKLKKIADDPELFNALPESIVYDSGNFEIILPPSDRVEDIASKIKTINTKFGVGSMQVTISSPRESFFQFDGMGSYPLRGVQEMSEEFVEKSFKANLGYYNFFNDLDTLEKMKNGFARYEKDPTQLTAKSFAHPWLGPTNKQRNDKLQELLKKHASGDMSDANELGLISTNINSHKFVSGTVYRPDVAWGKNRMANEVRDCHKNPNCLEDRLKREVLFHMTGKEKLVGASQLKAFDRNPLFNSLPSDVQKMLKETFPKYGSYSIDATEVYRNFSFPFRDWSEHVKFLGKPELSSKIKMAQDKYMRVLEVNAVKYKNGQITTKELEALIQGELNRFGVESGLSDAFESFYSNMVKDDKALVDFIKLTMLLQSVGREVVYG